MAPALGAWGCCVSMLVGMMVARYTQVGPARARACHAGMPYTMEGRRRGAAQRITTAPVTGGVHPLPLFPPPPARLDAGASNQGHVPPCLRPGPLSTQSYKPCMADQSFLVINEAEAGQRCCCMQHASPSTGKQAPQAAPAPAPAPLPPRGPRLFLSASHLLRERHHHLLLVLEVLLVLLHPRNGRLRDPKRCLVHGRRSRKAAAQAAAASQWAV